MPWIANRDGEPVTPESASPQDDLTCPSCDEEMYLIRSYTTQAGTFYARHFAHNPSRDGQSDGAHSGCGGESDVHKRLKSIAHSKLYTLFDDRIETIEQEMQVPDAGKIADIGVVFDEPIDGHDLIAASDTITGVIGDRLAVEVQYKNELKDIEATERAYTQHGYSVLWLYPDQFSDYDVDLFSGPGVTWTPIYPTILRPEVGFPDQWIHHEEYMPLDESSETTVGAAFPIHWFEGEVKDHLALNGPGPQYECWADLFTEVAEAFVDRAETLLEDPDSVAPLFDALYPTLDPTVLTSYYGHDSIPSTEAVCGNCYHSEPDQYRDDDRAIICWKNTPKGSGDRPRKLTLSEDFAQKCPHFSYKPHVNQDVLDEMDLQHSLGRGRVLKKLLGAKGATDRDRRKAALKLAYDQTWGAEDWNPLKFSPGREEGLLRHLDSEYAVSHEDGCATRGDTVFPDEEDEAQTTSDGGAARLSDFIE